MDDVRAPMPNRPRDPARRGPAQQAARDHSPAARQWVADNQAAVAAWDGLVDEHGLLYPDLRQS